jgi:hypothetical protein
MHQGWPLADKILLIPMIAALCGVILFMPVDVFRFRLMRKPATMVSSLS